MKCDTLWASEQDMCSSYRKNCPQVEFQLCSYEANKEENICEQDGSLNLAQHVQSSAQQHLLCLPNSPATDAAEGLPGE